MKQYSVLSVEGNVASDTGAVLLSAITSNVANNATGFFSVPSGTTAQRPSSPLDGMIRYNSTTQRTEFYSNGSWRNMARLEGDTFTGEVKADTIKKANGSGNYAVEDGTILYHTVRWFTPTGTFSSTGTAVTTTGSQLTASMVGAKIGVGTDKRIITAFLTSNTCTVDSAFSQNYVSQPLANWGVYSKAYENSAGLQIFYATDGTNRTQIGTNGTISASNIVQRFNRGLFGDGALSGHNAYVFNWSNSGSHDGTKDLGIRRNSAGVLEIFDGITNGVLRDLRLRNIIPTLTTYATDAAADADSSLPSGAFYKLTGLRTVFQKP